MLYSPLIAGKDFFHLTYQLIPDSADLLADGHPKALLGILAPFRAAKVNLRINHRPPTLSTLNFRFILKKLHGLAAAGTIHFENVLRLPKSLVLSGTSEHIYMSSIVPVK
jgi:hypothetical protein